MVKKAIALAAAFFVGIVFLKNPFFLRNISKIALSKKPETFTELYFTDHLDLPKQIELGTLYLFKFTVHNLEHKDFTYFYEVTAENFKNQASFSMKTQCFFLERCNKQILDEGQFLLKHDEIKTILVAFFLFRPFERMKITVNLANKNQPIHFWLEQEKF